MRLEWPHILWLSVPVVLLLWWRLKRPAAAVEYSSLSLLDESIQSWRVRWHRLPDYLRGAAILALLLGLARPRLEVSQNSATTRGVAIELLVDISSSMDMHVKAKDENITRLAAVKRVLERFILGDGEELFGRPNDLLGLITFARYADTASPLTTGHDALAEIVKALTIEDRPNEDGTAYGDAVTLAAARLRKLDDLQNRNIPGADVKSRVIVVLTDGENNCGRHLPLEATALARQWDIRIYVISLAGPIPGLTSAEIDAEGPSPAQQILMRMAEETGGIYRKAQDLDSLHAVYKEIDSLEKSEIRVEQYQEWRELFPFCGAFGLTLLFAQVVGVSTVFRRIP
jgi:Ca-activated chloride channel family protein